MQDRRKQPRKDLMSYSQVYDLGDGRLVGYLGDINLYGAMVISDHALSENQNIMISIELPELPKTRDTNIIMSVRVVWCHQDLSPDYYNVGLEFNGITERQKSLIQAVMDNYEFRRQVPNYPHTHPNELDDE